MWVNNESLVPPSLMEWEGVLFLRNNLLGRRLPEPLYLLGNVFYVVATYTRAKLARMAGQELIEQPKAPYTGSISSAYTKQNPNIYFHALCCIVDWDN